MIGSAHSQVEPIENESDNPPYILLHPEVCRLAGGGVAALVLEMLVYWVSLAADGLPRARPQRDVNHPTWPTPGLAKIAQLIGLDMSAPHRAAEKCVVRAVKNLQASGVIEKVEPDSENPPEHRNGRSCRGTELRLTEATSRQLQVAGLLQHGEYAGTTVKVWTADVRKLGVNEAIALGQLWYRCVTANKTFRITRPDGTWFPCNYFHLSIQTGLTQDQLREVIWGRKKRKTGQRHGLMNRGLVTVHKEMFRGNLTLLFRISPHAREVIQRMRGIEP